MTRLIDGRAAAAALREAVAARARVLLDRGIRPTLRVVLVGDHPASAAYVRTKERVAAAAGIDAAVIRLPAATSQALLVDEVARLSADPGVHGVLVQLPLPPPIDPQAVLAAMDPAKDVDGFHPANAGRLAICSGAPPPGLLVPCTPKACIRLLEGELGAGGLAGRSAVVVGRSTIVGRPLAQLLLLADCTVTIAHSRTRDLAAECRRAEILVVAAGRAGLVRGDWIRDGAVVVDVGINRVAADGALRLAGDVVTAEAIGRASAITPVPGGVGPMTVAVLLENTVMAAETVSPRQLP